MDRAAHIAKFLANECSEDEKNELNQWRSIAKNETEFNEYQRLWDICGPDTLSKHYYAETAFHAILKKSQDNGSGSGRRKTWIIFALSVIVSTLIIFSILFINGNGEKIIITSDTLRKKIELTENVSITLDRNGSVSYNEDHPEESVSVSGRVMLKSNTSVQIMVGKVKLKCEGLIMIETKQDTNGLIVTVIDGNATAMFSTSTSKTISDGETARIMSDEDIAVGQPNPNEYAWYTGIFKFDRTPLKDVISYLNDYYQEQIFMDVNQHPDCSYTGKFETATFKQVLKTLEKVYEFKYDRTGNKVKLKELHCD